MKNKGFGTPLQIIFIIAFSIFVAEAAVMLVFYFVALPELFKTLIDPVVLVLTLSPILYLFIFRPLINLIEERRTAEDELRKERDMAQRYLDVAGVMIVVLDTEGRVALINRKGCSILGYGEKDIIRKNWLDSFIPRKLRSEVELSFERLKEGDIGESGYFENPVLTKGGEERIILWQNKALKDERGRFSGILSSGEDITERKRAEKALRESENRYRLVHNTAFDGIVTADAEDEIIDCNPAAEKIFGYQKEELIGMPAVNLMPESYRERHLNGLRRFMETGISEVQGKVLELEALRKGGEVFPVELMLSSFTLGGAINFTGTIRDITERKKAEKEKELIQTQLSQSQKMEAIGRLAGGIAHDFNNILTAIRGNSELALDMVEKTSPAHARLNEIILSVLHASKLTRQLLLFGKGHPFELRPINVNSVVENLLVMVSRIIGDDIVISKEFAPDLWTIRADEGNMEQVVMNLAVNARDAMPGGGTLTIKTENVTLDEHKCAGIPGSQPGDYVCLAVSDTGSGMDKDVIQHIFEPFFTTKELGKGTGFGLAVVYGIIRQHKGCIKVESEPGRGTAFKIFLPAAAAAVKEAAAVKGPAPVPRGAGERVLLVEDEKMVREFARMALSENGFVVYEAENAKDATKIFERENGKFHIVFSDLVLADQSGLRLADQFTSMNPGLGVLITSSYAEISAQRETISRKGYRYLPKPYSLADLVRAVKDAIDAKRMRP